MSNAPQPPTMLQIPKIVRRVITAILSAVKGAVRRFTPSVRDLLAFTLSFSLAASVSWVAGGSAAYVGPGDVISFSEGSLYAPTVREPAPAILDRIARGFRLIVRPITPQHDATNFGDQAEIRETSRKAAISFLGRSVGVPKATTQGARINGGSSGLAWSLATLELEQPNLFGDRVFAASAMINGQNHIGPVGSLEEKIRSTEMATTDLLFVHFSQAGEARSLFRLQGGHRPVVVGVVSLQQAVGMLCALGASGSVCDRYTKLTKQYRERVLQVRLTSLDTGLCSDLSRLSVPLRCAAGETAVTVSVPR
jgi:hypothetical protein